MKTLDSNSRIHRPRIKGLLLYLLIGLATGLLFFSIATTEIYTVNPLGLGLATTLPIAFWVGLGSLSLVWFFGLKNKWVLAIALILTIGYLFLAPAIMRNPVWLSNSYYPFGESTLINSSGHFINRPWQPLNSYHDWPLFIYFSSILTQLSAISTTPLLKFFPVFIISACGVLSFLILRMKFTSSQSLLGAGIFLASFWYRQQYFGPPGFGFLFFLLGILIGLKYFFSNNLNKTILAGLLLLVFTSTLFTHFLSAIILLFSIVVLFISQRFVHIKAHFSSIPLIALVLAVFTVYNLFFTPDFFNYLLKVSSSLVSFQGGVVQEESRLVGSAAQVFNYRSTLGIIALDCIIPLIGILLTFKGKISRGKFFKDGLNVFWLCMLVVYVIFALFFQYGPHEGYQRALMFALLPLSYFSVLVTTKRPKVLVVIIIAVIFLNIPAQYGADSYTLEKETDLAGAHFVATYTPDKVVVLYDFSLLLRYDQPAKNITFGVLEHLPFSYVPNSTQVLEAFSACDYVVVSDTSNNYYFYFMQHTPIPDALAVKNDSLGFHQVYDNGNFIALNNYNK